MSEYSIRKIDSSAGITDVRFVEYSTIVVPKSGGTFTGNIVAPSFSGDGSNLTGIASVSEFSAHTGNTTIHYTKGSILLSELGDSAHTHTVSEIINLQNLLDGKVDVTLFNTYTGDTATELSNKALQADLVTHSGNTSIHFTKESLNSDFVNKSGDTMTGNLTVPVISATTVSGDTFYGDGSNLTNIPHTTDTYSTGGTYNASTDIITITNSTGGTFDITGVSDTFVTGQTFNTGDYKLTTVLNDNTTFISDLSILSSDMVVTGGTYDIDTGIVTFTNNSGSTFEVSGFTTGMTDSFTTSAILSGESITFNNNIYGANYYNVDLNPLLSGKTDVSLFNTYTGNTATALNNKVETSLFNTYTGDTATELAGKALQSDFVTHSGDTSIHFTKESLNSIFVNKSGDTMTGNLTVPVLSATTISGGTLYGDGSNLTGIGSGTGLTDTIVVGENVASGDLVYLKTDSKYWKADNAAEATSSTELRLVTETILADASGESLKNGQYITTGLTTGSTYWVGTGGTISASQPTANESIVRYVGTALNDTTLEFNPDELFVEISTNPNQIANPAYRTVTSSGNILATDWTVDVTTTGATTQILPTAVQLISI